MIRSGQKPLPILLSTFVKDTADTRFSRVRESIRAAGLKPPIVVVVSSPMRPVNNVVGSRPAWGKRHSRADSEVVGALEAAAAYSLKVAVLEIDEGKKHIVATS